MRVLERTCANWYSSNSASTYVAAASSPALAASLASNHTFSAFRRRLSVGEKMRSRRLKFLHARAPALRKRVRHSSTSGRREELPASTSLWRLQHDSLFPLRPSSPPRPSLPPPAHGISSRLGWLNSPENDARACLICRRSRRNTAEEDGNPKTSQSQQI